MTSAQRAAVAIFAMAVPALASARPQVHAPVHAPAAPLAPLPMLPSIPRVRIEVFDKKVVVVQEINLPRGEWTGEALDFYVAFGAPGLPRAIDAQLVSVGDGALEPEDGDAGEALNVERVPRRPPNAHLLLGRETMAGVVLRTKRESLTRAFAPGNMAALRVRTALDLPDEDSGGGRGLVVRLGAARTPPSTPLTLGRLSVVAKPGAAALSRTEAHLCGPDADRRKLAITLSPRPTMSPPTLVTIAPVLAVRHASDDLCIRFWTPVPVP